MRSFLLMGAALVLFSCGGSSGGTGIASGGGHGVVDASAGSGGGSQCAPGAEGCACYGNKTCDGVLTCASNLCVALGGSGGTAGAGGAPNSGGKKGLGGTLGIGGKLGLAGMLGIGGAVGTGGVPASGGVGGAGGAHECYPDQTICTNDPTGCCLGLRCVSEPNGPNAVCTAVCQTGGECASGCCASLAGGTANVCAPRQYCPDICTPEYSSCTSAVDSCCAGTLCIYDDPSQSTASCSYICSFDSDCLSGCCTPLGDGSVSVCANSIYCAGSCLPAGTRPCGLGTPCCPGSYCTSDAINQICLPLCSQNTDCASGCCAVPNGNGIHVCTDATYCP